MTEEEEIAAKEEVKALSLLGEPAPLERFVYFLRWLHYKPKPIRLKDYDGKKTAFEALPEKLTWEWAAFWHRAWQRSSGLHRDSPMKLVSVERRP